MIDKFALILTIVVFCSCPMVDGDDTLCSINNGGCAHKCNIINGDVSCSCDPGFALDDDQRACYSSNFGRWGQWSNWLACNVTCGGGMQRRMRFCPGSQTASDLKCMKKDGAAGKIEIESRACNTAPCQGAQCFNWDLNCDKYKELGDCIHRKAYMDEWCCQSCSDEFTTNPVIDGNWGEWSEYSECNVQCGEGNQTRTRMCDDPIPANRGLMCLETGSLTERSLSETETRRCVMPACPAYWTQWSEYGACSRTCAGGTQTRTRQCTGAGCSERSESESRVCNTDACPVVREIATWSQWTEYGDCSRTCGGGTQSRTRRCSGAACTMRLQTQTQACMTDACPTVKSESHMILMKENVCFGAKNDSYGSFVMKAAGRVHMLKLVHESGYISCIKGNSRNSNWGCLGYGINIVVTDDGNQIVLAKDFKDYLAGYTAISKEIMLKVGAEVNKGQEMRIWQIEDLRNKGEWNNHGTSCATVYANMTVHGAMWSEWSSYGACSQTCDGGEQSRTRECIGDACASRIERQTRACNNHACQVMTARWSEWTRYGECSRTCGGGMQTRSRQCTGDGCERRMESETQMCNMQMCPVMTARWSEWTRYGECSRTCGGGIQIRSRQCTGEGCEMRMEEQSQVCNTEACSDCVDKRSDCLPYAQDSYCTKAPDYMKENCCHTCKTLNVRQATWSEWSSYGECSKTCGGGEQSRTRSCAGEACQSKMETETRACSLISCPVRITLWSQWTSYGECSRTCGGGTRSRTRQCTGFCDRKEEVQTIPCNTAACPDLRIYSRWSEYSECSQTCGGGVQSRTRTCMGAGCDEREQRETRRCNNDMCPAPSSCMDTRPDCMVYATATYCQKRYDYMGVHCCATCKALGHGGGGPAPTARWTQWSEYGRCSQTCGTGGYQTRYRQCSGDGCYKKTETESRSCNVKSCPGTESWTQWSEYSECSHTCGINGYQTRHRQCSGSGCQKKREIESRSCNVKSCPGPIPTASWTQWSEYGQCSRTCGSGGFQTRTRQCSGALCASKTETESRRCYIQACPVYGRWSDYGECSKTCGSGAYQSRTRQCYGSACQSRTESQQRLCAVVKCPDEPVESCHANVGFVLDSSGTLTNEFHNAKRFLKRLAEAFGISRTGSRGSVITFSYTAVHNIKFDDYFTTSAFNDAVDRLRFFNSTTRIDMGLRLAQEQMFAERNGARKDLNNLLILFTDGEQTETRSSENPAMIAEDLRQSGVNVVVVGIGGATNPTKLLRIAGGHSNKVFYASTYEGLIQKNGIGDIMKENCIFVDPKVDCRKRYDVGFLLDASNSVKGLFNQEKRFLNTLANTHGISRDGTRAGVITFSHLVEHTIKLKDHDNINSFAKAVDAIGLKGSMTDIAKALRAAQRDFFRRENGGRDYVPDMLIMITDGVQTRGSEDPFTVARELRDGGIKIIAVGIGQNINKRTLTGITGDEALVFHVPDHADLANLPFLQKILKTTCHGGPERPTTGEKVCEDDWEICYAHVDKCTGYTNDWTAYMARRCKKTCRLC